MKSILQALFIPVFGFILLFTACCPPPCTKWIVNGATTVEPAGFDEPNVPMESDEFFYYKGKSGSAYNFSLARQAAIDDMYDKIFDSIYRRNRRASRDMVREIAVSGVLMVDEYNVKTTTPYRHRRRKSLTSTGVKYEVIVIARFPKREFMKALERISNNPPNGGR